jgi:uncharacterized protein with beta-barrel porin domain
MTLGLFLSLPHAVGSNVRYKPPAPEVFVPAFAAWPAALRRPAPPATLAQRPIPPGPLSGGGATPAKNSALTSAGAELRLANGVTLLGKFDGEFASHSSTYAGTGTVRYTW